MQNGSIKVKQNIKRSNHLLTFIYAQDINHGIGFENGLPWSLPNDLKFFKKMTMGTTIVMGRKTFESMGKRLLPNRKTVVLTRDTNYGKDIEGLTVVHTVDEIVRLSKQEKVNVIGGSVVFQELMPHATHIVRTVIHEDFDVDTWMPMINPNEWAMTDFRQGIVDDKNKYEHTFERWSRV